MTTDLGLQKVCDVHDLFHPEINSFLRDGLDSVPFGSRRAWEFAMIHRALAKKGKLHSEADGLGMGAGTERLIYALARHARKTVVTDLYEHDDGWVGVRTDDPYALVISKAPWAIDERRIEALSMDMRELKFPESSFDFAWSTGAFEHIGHDEDFARHLSEVHRVLRPGGVYAFTTAVVFGSPTLRIPHNYYFNPEHLVDLLHASPLHAEPAFDCNVTDHLFNRPHLERFQDFGFSAGHQLSKPIVSFRRGAIVTASVMVLAKDPARPKVRPAIVGYEASTRRLRRYAEKITAALWQEPQLLRPERQGEYLVVQPQYFGLGRIAIEITLAAGAPRSVAVTIKSRAVGEFHDWQVEHESKVSGTSAPIALDTVDGRIYAIHVHNVQTTDPERIIIRANRVDGAAGAVLPTGEPQEGWQRAPKSEHTVLRSGLERLRRAVRRVRGANS